MWFEDLMGFAEENPEQVRQNIRLEGNKITSLVNGKTYQCGSLAIPTLTNLRESLPGLNDYQNQIQVQEVVGNVREMHQNPENAGALFQAASQFNLLEMVGPSVSPEQGVGIYENDHTQGPACAIACGAGTIYRNYFVPLGDQVGQSKTLQVDCLDEIGKYFNNDERELWTMSNGYGLANSEGLKVIADHIQQLTSAEYEALKGKLRIGLQWDSEVTIAESPHLVSQAYCSALPLGYSQAPAELWQAFARLVLEATYEATFYAGLINFERTGNKQVYLTLVGGGVFGNDMIWIMDAIKKALQKFRQCPLEVKIVSYRQSSPEVQELLRTWEG
ncbi:MAG: hypothetical protein AAFU64_06325 [Bacteroidota bacterium]